MEYEKKSGNFSFGFGNMTAAGTGNLSRSLAVRKGVTKREKQNLLKSVLKAATAAGIFLFRKKRRKKK